MSWVKVVYTESKTHAMTNIKKPKELPLREYFNHEEYAFTPWLKRNLDLLASSNLLGFQLENAQLEVDVGPYDADMVAQSVVNDKTVVIENQLDSTDHDHLGKSLVYAAGEEADVVVWIAKEFTPEHARAVEMLNQRTDDELAFFGFEAGLIQIEESPYAIDFKPVVRPDDWSPVQPEEELSETEQSQLEFWEAFRSHLRENNLDDFASRGARGSPSYYISIGFSEATIRPTARFSSDSLLCLVRLDNNESSFAGLVEDQFRSRVQDVAASMQTEQIGPDIAEELEWEPEPDSTFDKIVLDYGNADFGNRENWSEYHQWLAETADVLERVLTEQLP